MFGKLSPYFKQQKKIDSAHLAKGAFFCYQLKS